MEYFGEKKCTNVATINTGELHDDIDTLEQCVYLCLQYEGKGCVGVQHKREDKRCRLWNGQCEKNSNINNDFFQYKLLPRGIILTKIA